MTFHCFYRKRECLRHFIVVLTENNDLQQLCHYNYSGIEDEVCQLHGHNPLFILIRSYSLFLVTKV